jgi:hypothetical protein
MHALVHNTFNLQRHLVFRDALVSTGAEVNETPITPRRAMAAIRKAREAAPKR